jgi:hypothetical protein
MNQEEIYWQALIAEQELQNLIGNVVIGILILSFVCLFLYGVYSNPDRRRRRERKKRMSYRQQRRRDRRVAMAGRLR